MERIGLVFGDDNLEWEFLSRAHYSRVARTVGAVGATLAASLFAYTFYIDFELTRTENNVGVLAALGFIGSAVTLTALLFWVSRFVKKGTAAVRITQAASYIFGLSLVGYIPYTLYDSQYNAKRFTMEVHNMLVNLTDDPYASCKNATIYPQFPTEAQELAAQQVCDIVGVSYCSPYTTFTLYSVFFGYQYESFIGRLLAVWTAFEALVVIGFIPVRVLMFFIPLGVMTLLGIVGQFRMDTSLSNLQKSIESAVECNAALLSTLVSFLFELTISIFAASVAMLMLLIARSRKKRELFYWTKTLGVSSRVVIVVRRRRRRCCCCCCKEKRS